MPISVTCQRCGNAVGPDATHGLCPACLLEQGLRDSCAEESQTNAAAIAAAEIRELARLFPQLEVLELLGRGGMGVVYKARQRGLDRLVALKILPPGVDRDPGFQERFVREARALARLNHPNIVAVYDFGQVEGRYYFLMEFIDGVNLRRMLEAGHLAPQQAMAIVPQLCDALQFAHEEGIVHRDIKPENILVDRKGRVKIADFGLAKLLTGSVPQDPYTLTAPRQVLGTPHYMAPEQLERPGTVDHRADIYSMGVVFYEMLTGELPLGRFPPPSRKVQVDVRLDEVVLRTLEKEPEQRYQRAGEVKTELATLSVAMPPGGGPPTWRAGGQSLSRPQDPTGPAPRLSRLAIAGLIVALIFPLMIPGLGAFAALHEATATAEGGGIELPSPAPALVAAMTGLAAIGVICAVVSCWLGIAGIRQIRRSQGRLWGLGLALFDAMAYPLLIANCVVVAVLMALFEPPDRAAGFFFLVTLGGDVFLFLRIRRRISQPLPLPPSGRVSMTAPARPWHTPDQYALPPRRRVGCVVITAVIAVLVALVALIVVACLVFGYARLQHRPATLAMTNGYVAAEMGSDPGGSPRLPHDYRFVVNSPPDTRTIVWAEIWRDGKIEPTPGFPVTQWVIPPAGRSFVGTVTFRLGEPKNGQLDAAWDVTGGQMSSHAEHLIPDPFEGTTVNDTTWRPWGSITGVPRASENGAWTPIIGHRVQVLCVRGFRSTTPLPGTLTDESVVGRADGEIRVYVRFDPMVTPNLNSRYFFGSGATPPTAGSPGPPTSQPASASGEADTWPGTRSVGGP